MYYHDTGAHIPNTFSLLIQIQWESPCIVIPFRAMIHYNFFENHQAKPPLLKHWNYNYFNSLNGLCRLFKWTADRRQGTRIVHVVPIIVVATRGTCPVDTWVFSLSTPLQVSCGSCCVRLPHNTAQQLVRPAFRQTRWGCLLHPPWVSTVQLLTHWPLGDVNLILGR